MTYTVRPYRTGEEHYVAEAHRRLILWSASPLRDALRHYETLGFTYEEKTENREWSLDGDVVYEIKMSLSLQ